MSKRGCLVPSPCDSRLLWELSKGKDVEKKSFSEKSGSPCGEMESGAVPVSQDGVGSRSTPLRRRKPCSAPARVRGGPQSARSLQPRPRSSGSRGAWLEELRRPEMSTADGTRT
nr:uncharacterized protein LOC106838399 isoform X1 [Equus asinus]